MPTPEEIAARHQAFLEMLEKVPTRTITTQFGAISTGHFFPVAFTNRIRRIGGRPPVAPES